MKHILVSVLIGMFLLVGCTANQTTAEISLQSDSGEARIATLGIEQMTCPSCAMGVEYQLKQLLGVYDADISYLSGKGKVQYDASQISAEEIAAASTTYPASVLTDELI